MRMHLNNFDQVDIFNLDRRETCRETHVAKHVTLQTIGSYSH